jgi:hypothetical protein
MSESFEQSPKGQKNIFGGIVRKFSDRIRGRESSIPIEIQIIDENDPQNVLSYKSRKLDLSFRFGGIPYSGEGFAENQGNQEKLAHCLIQKLNLKERGPLLDVGFGSNIHISNTFSDEGIKAFAIDELQHDHTKEESILHPPRKENINEKGVEILSGDIADLDNEKSDLKDKKFGLILFNGSWAAGGNNFTVVGEVMESKYYSKQDKNTTMVEFMNREKDAILQSCEKHLANAGIIGIVSSRYAFHGAGWSYDQLPDEKLCAVDVYDRFRKLGAKKIYLFGITQKGFDEMLKRSTEQLESTPDSLMLIREQLIKVSSLPREDVYSRNGDNPQYQKSLIARTIEETKDMTELDGLARIDAIFAEF